MSDDDAVYSVIEAFGKARRCEEIERAADRLSEMADLRSAGALIYRLGDSAVQEDPDVEDAVCSALVQLGIMEKLGNLNFRFRPRRQIPSEVRILAHERYRMLVPSKYFDIHASHHRLSA